MLKIIVSVEEMTAVQTGNMLKNVTVFAGAIIKRRSSIISKEPIKSAVSTEYYYSVYYLVCFYILVITIRQIFKIQGVS